MYTLLHNDGMLRRSFVGEGRMRRVVACALIVAMTFVVAAAGPAETVTVAAAISLKDALAKVAERYKSDTGESVQFTLGSSGQLANQIANGDRT